MSDYLLAFDIGTTGNKAVLVDAATGQIIGAALASYNTIYTADGGAEQSPTDWWDSAAKASEQLRANFPAAFQRIIGVGCGGMMNGLVAVDAHGQSVANSMIHADVRGAQYARSIERSYGIDSIYARTLNRPDSHLTLPKVMWLADNRPDTIAKASFIVQSNDYLAGRLTGTVGVTDPSNASLTGAFDPVKREWVRDLWTASGLDSAILPEVRPSTSILGAVSTEASRITGIRAGTPVVVGGGDGACASAGSGVATGEAYNYLGGTSWIGLVTPEPILDVRLSSYCCLDERLTTFGTVQAAGSAVQWIGHLIDGEAPDFARLDQAASAAPPGSRRLFFLPYLQGERAPLWDDHARGAFFGLATHHGKPEIYRAVLEGVAYALGNIVDVFAENGQRLAALRLLGGGAGSALWTQILAAVLDRPLRVVEDLSSATSLGAALAAGVGVGCWPTVSAASEAAVKLGRTVRNDQALVNQYAPLAVFFGTLYPAMTERFHALSELSA